MCWPEVVILHLTTSATIIGHLCKIFAIHRLPEKVLADNGANLVSEEFKNLLETWHPASDDLFAIGQCKS